MATRTTITEMTPPLCDPIFGPAEAFFTASATELLDPSPEVRRERARALRLVRQCEPQSFCGEMLRLMILGEGPA